MSADDRAVHAQPSVRVGMGVRRPPAEVFRALTQPDLTTKFWFTRSTGPVEPGAQLQWDWEMYGASAQVSVVEVVPDERIVFEWGGEDGSAQTVTIELRPWGSDRTYVEITETGFDGGHEEVLAWVADSTGGFTQMLASLKAFLEHDLVLTLVLDHHPHDL